MKAYLVCSLLVCAQLILSSCQQESQEEKQLSASSDFESQASISSQPFMGMVPTDSPVLLFPDLIGSSLDEYNGTFSPDGREFFFTTNTPSQGIICYMSLDASGQWTEAEVAAFSGTYSEYDPLFSPDGERLYFTSQRPANENDSSGKTNIWYVEKSNSIWDNPQLVALEEKGTYFSSLTKSGDIYFNIWDTGDMYKASTTSDGYEVQALPDVINSSKSEGDPFISPDEDYLIFRGYTNSLGRGDLYISYRINEKWTEPENLGEPINSMHHEMCPYVTPDGKYFIFASSRINEDYDAIAGENLQELRSKHHSPDNGQLNIYYISADFISEGRRKFE